MHVNVASIILPLGRFHCTRLPTRRVCRAFNPNVGGSLQITVFVSVSIPSLAVLVASRHVACVRKSNGEKFSVCCQFQFLLLLECFTVSSGQNFGVIVLFLLLLNVYALGKI